MSGPLGERLDAVLAALAAAGQPARFWLRDDDATTPTDALDRLLSLSDRHGVPLALASIPAAAEPALARHLAGRPNVRVLVHGWAHRNHAPRGEKKQELGPHRPGPIVLRELAEGLSRIAGLFGDQARPVLVPPWNRIDASLLPRLPELGFAALSVFGPSRPAPLPVVNTTVDIIDWHGTRGCRDHAELAAEIAGQLEARAADPSLPPLGVLTHHLVHDEAAWVFLDRLFAATTSGGSERWLPIDALLA